MSPGGVVESRINLEIARRVDGIFGFCGEPALMLRTEDISSTTWRRSPAGEEGVRPAQPGRYGVVIPGGHPVERPPEYVPAVPVPGDPGVLRPHPGLSGAGPGHPGVVRESLQPDNSRESKPIPDTVYLMNHIPNRAVLVECGFLSNPEEEGLLQDPKYQTKLAAAIAAGCLVGGSASL